MNTTNEERLIRAAQRGSLEAFHQLVHGFDRPMLDLALRITGAEQAARSIYCETMLGLHASVAAVEFECSWRVCAYRILAKLCLEYLSRERDRAMEGGPGEEIRNVVATLSPRERIVFELRHYHGLDLRTVGKVLDTTEEVARNVLVRAGHKLRAALVEDVASTKSKGGHAEDSSHR